MNAPLNILFQSSCELCGLCCSPKLSRFTQCSINQAHLTVVFTGSTHIAELLKNRTQTPQLKLIVSIDNLEPELKDTFKVWAETVHVELQELRERMYNKFIWVFVSFSYCSGGFRAETPFRPYSTNPRHTSEFVLYVGQSGFRSDFLAELKQTIGHVKSSKR